MRIRARVWEYHCSAHRSSATNYWTTNHADLIENFATALGYAGWATSSATAPSASRDRELGTRIENNAKRMRPSRMTVAPGQRAGKPTSSVGAALGESYRQYNP
jgi:hypothetical protein